MSGDILREVDDAMRVEKVLGFWRDHGKVIAGGVALVVLATALHAGWSAWQDQQYRTQTAQLIEAFKAKEPHEALVQFTKTSSGNSKAIAGLAAASLAAEHKDVDAALVLYAGVAEDAVASPVFRGQAIIQSVSLKFDTKDDVTGDVLLEELEPVLTGDLSKSMWAARAKILSAMVKAHKMKNFDGAIADLNDLLAMQGIPADLLNQATMLREVYSVKMGEKRS